MRPVRLELEGFTAFADRTVVDLDGVDLFALSGPTGAGKTSVIDAVTFALYGSVPRLGERAVAPVVTQGRAEARVGLDFTVGGVAHRVVRVVAVRGSGASTKEARLERGSTVLADDANGVTAAVTELLGLDFAQFTTCVSLPQGDFARFLHDKPRDRQDLLVRLLDLGLYEAVRVRSSARAALAAQRVQLTEGQLAELAWATDEAVAAAEARVSTLDDLRAAVEAAQPAIAAATAEAEDADRRAARAADAVRLLSGVQAPAGVAELAGEVVAAREALAAAHDGEAAAEAALASAEADLAALPARADLEAVAAARSRIDALQERIEKGRPLVAAAEAAATAAAGAVVEAERAAGEAAAALAEAQAAHRAHALAADLVVGEACPVCRQVVAEVPSAKPADVAAAERRVQAAGAALASARAGAQQAQVDHTRLAEQLAGLLEQRTEAEQERDRALARVTPAGGQLSLDDLAAGDEPSIAGLLASVGAAEQAVQAATADVRAARSARAEAARRLEAASEAEAAGRRAFDAARDAVAALGPPPAARVDLAADWTALVEWVDRARPAALAEATEAREAAATARDEARSLSDGVVARCRAVGVEVPQGTAPIVAVTAARTAAGTEVDRVAEAVAKAGALRASVAADVEARDVARKLADLLAANRFERWLLDEVLHHLVASATVRLRELSDGAYSLTLNPKDRSFSVIDHVNADTVRSAKTLSGGETFLASLALALALADQVAAYGTGSGGARLETILLDEGFGTLDAETLDVVATALEELGAGGRMVGIVTHVRELAERLPVRFEVTKVGGAASIERVDA